MKIIYGILEQQSIHGVQAYAIDGETGEIIDSHFCSSENFAKSDLGFVDPIMRETAPGNTDPHSTIYFNKQRHEKYDKLYPEGYQLEWIGDYHGNSKIELLLENNRKNESV